MYQSNLSSKLSLHIRVLIYHRTQSSSIKFHLASHLFPTCRLSSNHLQPRKHSQDSREHSAHTLKITTKVIRRRALGRRWRSRSLRSSRASR
jgi:hypothetical protein